MGVNILKFTNNVFFLLYSVLYTKFGYKKNYFK